MQVLEDLLTDELSFAITVCRQDNAIAAFERRGNRLGPVCKRLQVENADRTVPQNRLRTGDLRAVVDQLIRETAEGVCEPFLGPPLDSVDSREAAVPGSMPMPVAPLSPVRGQSVP